MKRRKSYKVLRGNGARRGTAGGGRGALEIFKSMSMLSALQLNELLITPLCSAALASSRGLSCMIDCFHSL